MDGTKFDPTKVPTFPLVRLALTAGGAVLVDDEYVASSTGDDATVTATGVALVAQQARAQGLDAVRVRAVTPERSYDMVVTAAGDTYDVTAPPDRTKTRRRRVVALSVVTGVLLASGAGAGAVLVLQNRDREPAATAEQAFTPPGAGANLPVHAPAGFAQRAAWSVPVTSRSTPLVLPDGGVIALDTGGSLVGWDSTGRRVWSGGPWYGTVSAGTVEDRPVLMGATSQAVSLWPLDVTPAEASVLEFGARGEVDVSGSVPLIVLPDQTVEVLGPRGLVRRDVPVAATAVASTTAGVVAASQDAWWLIGAAGEPVRHTLPTPAGATGPWERLIAGDDTHLIGVWPAGQDQVVAVIDLTTDQVTTATVLASGSVSEQDDVVRDPTADVLVVGGAYVAFTGTPRVVDLGELRARAVAGDLVYGTHERAAVLADTTTVSVPLEQYATPDQDTGELVAVTADLAYVLAHKVDATYLYALPRVPTAQEQQ
ncbi:hypothetical protein [Cellulomonas hominis]|uniref:hypothetical protein n=1 Tax=Cellulomonas hominis TaxID=156981 RepID=UPI001B9D712C|nr:hypothetical protein [Cellulomonas hominis]VTR76032.1 hypothetical protein CHMI_00788 [Cellulomonas hominis]